MPEKPNPPPIRRGGTIPVPQKPAPKRGQYRGAKPSRKLLNAVKAWLAP